jgi:hypothetical protein
MTKKPTKNDKSGEKKVTVKKATVKDLEVEPGKQGDVKGGAPYTYAPNPGCSRTRTCR